MGDLIRDNNGRFKKGSGGRPKGAKGKIPSRSKLIELLDTIVDDLLENYDSLNKYDKIRILQHSIRLYEDKEKGVPLTEIISSGITFDFLKDSE